jgi:signal transduction histidine kinase
MTEASSERSQSFVVQPRKAEASGQPLALHHLSHDLRGPLNSILGFAELLMEGIEGPLNENQQEDITAIYRSARNLLHLINSVVDLSKLDADKLKVELGTVNLNEVIEKIVAYDFGLEESKRLEVVSEVDQLLPQLLVDRNRVEQIITNLVRFGLRMQQEGQMTITAENDDRAVILQLGLEDVSLSDEQISELFELVVHTDNFGHTKLGLGGLELPLAQLLAEKHQGHLWVERNEASGTTFNLKLPVHRETES